MDGKTKAEEVCIDCHGASDGAESWDDGGWVLEAGRHQRTPSCGLMMTNRVAKELAETLVANGVSVTGDVVRDRNVRGAADWQMVAVHETPLLDALGVPYTGARGEAASLTVNKLAAKRVMSAADFLSGQKESNCTYSDWSMRRGRMKVVIPGARSTKPLRASPTTIHRTGEAPACTSGRSSGSALRQARATNS